MVGYTYQCCRKDIHWKIYFRENSNIKEKYKQLQYEVNMLRAKCDELEASKQAALDEV